MYKSRANQYSFAPQALSIRGHFFGQLLSCRFSSPVAERGHLCISDRNPIMDKHLVVAIGLVPPAATLPSYSHSLQSCLAHRDHSPGIFRYDRPRHYSRRASQPLLRP
jgi:hypothetical protein